MSHSLFSIYAEMYTSDEYIMQQNIRRKVSTITPLCQNCLKKANQILHGENDKSGSFVRGHPY